MAKTKTNGADSVLGFLGLMVQLGTYSLVSLQYMFQGYCATRSGSPFVGP